VRICCIFALMKKISAIISALLLVFLFQSCDNEVSTIGEWEDITAVYGLLNQNDSISYIKITKAFLGEGNALTFAQVTDSSEYDIRLEVSVEEYNEGQYVKTIDFDTTTVYNKEEGIFYSGSQQVYKAVTKNMLDDGNTYKLVIHNPETGKTITGETSLVDGSMVINKPIINNAARPTINIQDNEYPKEVQVTTTKNGRRYGVYATFHYEEVFVGNTTPVQKSIVWRSFPVRKSSGIEGGDETLNFDFITHSFWDWLIESVPYEDLDTEDSVEERYAGQLVFTFEVAEDQFNTYMEVNEPTTSIVQDRPEFTNIENGIGLFSARYSKERAFFLSEVSSNMLWNDFYELKFINPVNK